MANTSPYEVRNRTAKLATDGRFTFGNADLDYDDAEQPDSQITYTITTATANGTLFKSGVALLAGGSFTQADIDAGRISYSATLRSDGTAPSDVFRFQVTDGQGGYVGGKQFTLTGWPGSGTFAAIEQANSGLTVVRGGSIAIDVLNLNYDNGAAADSDVVFRITSAPATGTLRKDGSAIGAGATFTQADIDAGRISYLHDGSASTTASFGFGVTDSRGASISGKSFTFDIAATNTAPTEIFNTGVSVLAGNSVRITPDVLNYADAQQRDTQLYYTVTSLPSVGTLNRTIRLGDGSFITVALKVGDRFTDAEIVGKNALSVNEIFYTAPAGTPATDTSFGFSVSDGQGGVVSGKSLAIFVETANTAPKLVSYETLGVTSGSVGTFTSGNLRAIDSEQNDTQLFYGALNVSGGTVRKDGVALGYTDRFSQQDVNDGRITFVSSNGGAASGSFNFSVNDSVGGSAGARTVNIVFNAPPNTAPLESVNTGLQARAGQTTTITQGMLDYDDREQPDGSITYSLTALPSQGAIIWRGRALVLGDRFTQSDITAGVVAFQASAGFTGTTSFGFQVTDGAGGSAQGRSFSISALSATNTSPYETVNTGLKLTAGTTAAITASNLDYDDREQPDSAVLYSLTAAPTNGTVLLNGVALSVGGRFTQDDLNAGRVTYRADTTPAATSSFGFQVNDGQGGYVGGKTFQVKTVAPNTSPYETANTGLRITSGQTVTITGANLDYDDREQTDTSIFYTLTSAPAAGAVLVGGTTIGVGGRFTQDDINSGRVEYRANASQPASASFGFQVTDGAGGYVGGKTVQITGFATNTSPVEAINTGLRAGSGQTVAISANTLDYNDREQADTSIFYTITSAPSAGAVSRSGVTLAVGGRFTQDDINLGLVSYRADAAQPATASFGFQVTDGAGGYVGGKTVRIDQPAAPNSSPYEVVNTGLRVTSGQNVTIGGTILDYDDREQADTSIVFTVTSAPTAGTILRSGTALVAGGRFTQDDINNGLVTYRADPSQPATASIGFQVTDGQGGYVGGKTIRIVNSATADAVDLDEGIAHALIFDSHKTDDTAVSAIMFGDQSIGTGDPGVTILI